VGGTSAKKAQKFTNLPVNVNISPIFN